MRGDPLRWLSVRRATVNLIRGLSTGISLLPRLAPDRAGASTGPPSGWTPSQDTAPCWHQASPGVLWTQEGWAGSNMSWICGLQLKNLKSHTGTKEFAFPQNFLYLLPGWVAPSLLPASPFTCIASGATTTPACLFVLSQCGLIQFYQKKTRKHLWFLLNLWWAMKCRVLLVGRSTAEMAFCRLGEAGPEHGLTL